MGENRECLEIVSIIWQKKLLKNISWLCAEKICRVFGALVVGIWLARYLGPDDFGVFNYALAYISFFMLFVNFGFDQIVVREIVKKLNWLIISSVQHKLFSHISKNWNGQLLASHDVAVRIISSTKTKTGLKVKAKIDRRVYPRGRKISEEEIADINLVKHKFYGEWNYIIRA